MPLPTFIQPDAEADRRYLVRLLAGGYLALLAATWPLWKPQTVFPQVPLISIAGQMPRCGEWGLLVILLASLGVMAFVTRPRINRLACLLMGLSTLGLVCIDQHRLQPWAWQFVILSLVLATADDSAARSCWRWLVIGIYTWSAWSKMDQGFCVGHGRFLLDGFCKSIGLNNGTEAWPERVRWCVTAAIPLAELLIALGLSSRRTRGWAVIGAAIMHVGLLLALGPFGHGHQPGVLIWNVFFLVQNWLLFISVRYDQAQVLPIPSKRAASLGNSFARFVVFAAMLWPSLESFGLCDHWPAWAVYAAKPERVTVFVQTEELAKLPENMKRYLGTQPILDEWHPLRIDRWSLDAVYAPIYPQDRYQVGVALELARRFDLRQIRVVIEGPANRWTGKRTVHQYIGTESVNNLADSFRCSAQPRSGQFSTP